MLTVAFPLVMADIKLTLDPNPLVLGQSFTFTYTRTADDPCQFSVHGTAPKSQFQVAFDCQGNLTGVVPNISPQSFTELG
jgi:hypothetical protein